MPAVLTLFVCSVALVLVALKEVAASCAGGNCAAAEASSTLTNGAALLQLKGTVAKRGTADEAHAAGHTESAAHDAAALAAHAAGSLLHERSEAQSSMSKKPVMVSDSTKDGFGKVAGSDFKFGANNNNNDNDLDVGAGNNDNNLDTSTNNNNNDVRKELESVENSFDPTKDNNNNNMDFTNDDKDLSKKDKTSGKKDGEKLDNIDTPPVDNFDFGEGKVKQTEKEASEGLQKRVDKAVRKLDSALKDAAASEKAVHDGLERIVHDATAGADRITAKSIEDLKKISDTIGEAESKVKEAQKAVERLKGDAIKSDARSECGPRSWLLAFACSWFLSHLL